MPHFLLPQRRIDRNDNRADAYRAVMDDQPLDPIDRPDRDPVAALYSRCEESRGITVVLPIEFGITEPLVLEQADHRVVPGETLRRLTKCCSDRDPEQRRIRDAASV